MKEISVLELEEIMTKDTVKGLSASVHLLDVRYLYWLNLGWLLTLTKREPIEWNELHIPYASYTGRGNLERDIVWLRELTKRKGSLQM